MSDRDTILIRRRPDGSIDTDVYVKEAVRLRHASTREIVRGLASLLGAMRRNGSTELPAVRRTRDA